MHAEPKSFVARYQERPEFWLLTLSAGFLTFYGLVMMASASNVVAIRDYGNSFHYIIMQIAATGVGGLVAYLIQFFDYRKLRVLSAFWIIGTLGLLVMVQVVGNEVAGQRNWLQLGPVSLQPSEFAKLAIPAAIAWIASFSNRHRISDVTRWVWMVLTIGVFLGLVLAGNDLGNPVVMGVIGFVSIALVGMPWSWLWKIGAAGVVAVGLFIFLGPSWKAGRIQGWLWPEEDPAGAGYQLLHGQYALAQGGWFGNGYGSSLEKWGALPAPHTDFILPVIVEEVGIFGSGVIFLGLYVLAVAAFRIGAKSKDLLGRLVGAGFGTWIGVQTVINVGGVNGMLPITGLPLPFISYGGTSMFMMMTVVGILYVVERDNHEVQVAARIAQQEVDVAR